jgi:hypothetical protein
MVFPFLQEYTMNTFIQRHVTPLTSGVYSLLERLLPAREESIHGEWITNQTGQLSYRAYAFPLGDGTWDIAVLSRSGRTSSDYRYKWCRIALKDRYRRTRALREANRLAEQLATLRYRFSVGFAK